MTSQEFRRQRREIARRKEQAAELAAAKAARDEATRRTRAARETAAFALRHHLPPDRIYVPEPRVKMPGNFGGLRPSPRPEELARRSQRVDQVLRDLGR